MKFQSHIAFVTLILLILSSCGEHRKSYVIGFSQCTGNDDWRKTMLREMELELSLHDNLEFIYKDAEANSQKQIEQIEELQKLDIDLLIVSPNEVQPLTPAIEKVYDKGVPVVIIDRRTGSTKYTSFIGASNFEVGQTAGRYAAAILKGKGNIIEVTGIPDASPVIDRHNGFMDAIHLFPELKFKKEFVNYVTSNEKLLNNPVEIYLKANPNIDLIYAQNDFMANDLYSICKKLNLHKKIKIIGIDGLASTNAGLDMVQDKKIAATVLYPTGGKEAIKYAIDILENKPFKKENTLATTVIDSTNVRIMKQQGEKLVEQQKYIIEGQNRIQQQLIISKNQTTLIIIITLALIMALILGGSSYYYLRENKKINNALVKQKNEIIEQKNQLELMSAKAEEAHQAKINFFTNISHEFRTPLTLILTPIEELLISTKAHPSVKTTLHLVQKNVIRLYRLVNQLMDFRKIEFKKFQLRTSENNIVDFIKEIIHSYDVLANQKNITLKLFTEQPVLNVFFDVTMIDKVIFNLLSNAFKYTNENGYIYATISQENNFAKIKIEDNGVGMSPETINNAFEPFFQGEYENYRGTGLGLALSKEFIELHHGFITVKSEKWKGTTFEILLPLGNEHFSPDEMIVNPNITNQINENAKIYTTELYERKDIWEESNVSNQHKEQSILIIEDNEDLSDFLKSNLDNKYDVLQASNSIVALQLTFENVPDLIITDVVIPGKNGLEITKILKSDIRTSHIPIILLTARSDEKQKIEGLQSKADAYITKPFNLQYLEETIITLLQNREKVKSHFSTDVLNEAKSTAIKKTDRKFISDFMGIVENNISNENFNVQDICKEIGISRVQLYRKVNSILNCNVTDYITNARIQKAKFYLKHEELTISEIAFKTGFSSATYFSSVFKNKVGCTPSEYK